MSPSIIALNVLVTAFQVWMLVDAVRRQVKFYWYILIVVLPLGSLAYFFVVKLRDYNLGGVRAVFGGPVKPALDGLRQRALLSPSVENRLDYADALEDQGQDAEAGEIYRDVLRGESDNKRALHGLARSLVGQGEARAALRHFETLLELDNSYRNYGAALDYAEALAQAGEVEEAADLMRGLVGVSPRINHRLALAHYLSRAGKVEQASVELNQALSEYESQPASVQRQQSRWAKRARAMLRELEASTELTGAASQK